MDDQKHSLLRSNGNIYNANDDTHICRIIARMPITKNIQKSKEEDSAVAD